MVKRSQISQGNRLSRNIKGKILEEEHRKLCQYLDIASETPFFRLQTSRSQDRNICCFKIFIFVVILNNALGNIATHIKYINKYIMDI